MRWKKCGLTIKQVWDVRRGLCSLLQRPLAFRLDPTVCVVVEVGALLGDRRVVLEVDAVAVAELVQELELRVKFLELAVGCCEGALHEVRLHGGACAGYVVVSMVKSRKQVRV